MGSLSPPLKSVRQFLLLGMTASGIILASPASATENAANLEPEIKKLEASYADVETQLKAQQNELDRVLGLGYGGVGLRKDLSDIADRVEPLEARLNELGDQLGKLIEALKSSVKAEPIITPEMLEARETANWARDTAKAAKKAAKEAVANAQQAKTAASQARAAADKAMSAASRAQSSPGDNLRVATYKSGNRYAGQFANKKKSGFAVYDFASGSNYKGQFANGKRNGPGVYVHHSGSRFEGTFVNDKRSGFGVYYTSTGTRQECKWASGDRQYCVTTFKSGARVEGDQDGLGIHFYKDGDRYFGEFVRGKKSGLGVYYFSNGTNYAGQFENGQYHGMGIFTYKSGNRFEGESRGGIGVFGSKTYTNGDHYIGEFGGEKKYHRNGRGKIIYADGRVDEGTWLNDKFVGE